MNKIRIGEKSYRVPPLAAYILASNTNHESWLDDVYASVLRCREGAFVDVGVNTGQTLIKLLRIDPGRRYIGFEPQVTPASVVEQFIIENNLSHLSIFPIGLSNTRGLVSLNVRGHGYKSSFSSVASMVDNFRPRTFYTYSKDIFVVPGDEVLAQLMLQDVSLIKIDVEGGEPEVIEGLSKTIESHSPFILFEVLHDYLAVTREHLSEDTILFRKDRIKRIEKELRSKNYSIYHINANLSLAKIAEIKPKRISELSTTDYLAVPHSCEDEFTRDMAQYRRVIR